MIFVTGSGGTVGRYLVSQLQASGARFRVGHHLAQKVEQARQDGFDACPIDFAEPNRLRRAFEGTTTLFLLAANGPGQIEKELNAIAAARDSGVKRLVKLSAWRAAQEDFSFARIHRTIERAVETSGLAWCFLRPCGFMQNFSNVMAPSIKATSAFHQAAGNARVSHIDVRDVAEVAVRVLTTSGHDGMAYELSGSIALTYHEAADILSKVLGRKITYVSLTDDEARARMRAAGLPDPYIAEVIDLFQAYRRGCGEQVTPDVRALLGRDPTTFEQFARDHASSFG